MDEPLHSAIFRGKPYVLTTACMVSANMVQLADLITHQWLIITV